MSGFGRTMDFEVGSKDRSSKIRIEVVRSNNNIAILCTMKYKTRDEGHENSVRLPQILVDDDRVMRQGSHTSTMGRWQAHEAIGKPQWANGRHTRLSLALLTPRANVLYYITVTKQHP